MHREYAKALRTLKGFAPVCFSDREFHRKLSPHGGVYVVSRGNGDVAEVIYIGKAASLRGRLYQNLLNGQLRSHTLSRKCLVLHQLRNKAGVKRFLREQCSVRWVTVPDKKERSFVEHFLIAHFRSPLND
jgi:excinuclease UvrABC nuclease subunit